jgi:DNA-binding MarR family transcriptional regulator
MPHAERGQTKVLLAIYGLLDRRRSAKEKLRLPLSAVKAAAGISPAALTRALKRLASRGLIETNGAPHKRVSYVELTWNGWHAAADMRLATGFRVPDNIVVGDPPARFTRLSASRPEHHAHVRVIHANYRHKKRYVEALYLDKDRPAWFTCLDYADTVDDDGVIINAHPDDFWAPLA